MEADVAAFATDIVVAVLMLVFIAAILALLAVATVLVSAERVVDETE